MLTDKFRELLTDYQRKRWFPAQYPDPFGELIDYVSDGMISDLMDQWKQTANFSHLATAHFLYGILSTIRYGDIYREYTEYFKHHFSEHHVLPQFAFYFVRKLEFEDARTVWREFTNWNETFRPTATEWFQVLMRFEDKSQELLQEYSRATATDRYDEWKQILVSRGELFRWKCSQFFKGDDLFDWTRYSRFNSSDLTADWNDLPALSRSLSEHFPFTAKLRKEVKEEAAIFLFPSSPPEKVTLQYGVSAGPVDALRFLVEYGRGLFFRGMNPALQPEEKFYGDSSLPWFWGFLFAQPLASPQMLEKLIGTEQKDLAMQLEMMLEFWYRQDLSLSIYRHELSSDLINARDLYVSCFERAFPFLQPPHFLYLYDLERATDAPFRATAHQAVHTVLERLLSLYGYRWVFSPKFAARCRDYWWEGFKLKLTDVVSDLSS